MLHIIYFFGKINGNLNRYELKTLILYKYIYPKYLKTYPLCILWEKVPRNENMKKEMSEQKRQELSEQLALELASRFNKQTIIVGGTCWFRE